MNYRNLCQFQQFSQFHHVICLRASPESFLLGAHSSRGSFLSNLYFYNPHTWCNLDYKFYIELFPLIFC
jgi:hypothetical protein